MRDFQCGEDAKKIGENQYGMMQKGDIKYGRFCKRIGEWWWGIVDTGMGSSKFSRSNACNILKKKWLKYCLRLKTRII